MNGRDTLKFYGFREEVFDFDGAVSVEITPEYAAPWRIDYHERELYPVLKDGVGKYGAGIRLCFETDSCVIGFRLSELEEAVLIDLMVNGEYEKTIEITEIETIIDGLAPNHKRIKLWLPQNRQLIFAGILVEESSSIQKCGKRRALSLPFFHFTGKPRADKPRGFEGRVLKARLLRHKPVCKEYHNLAVRHCPVP